MSRAVVAAAILAAARRDKIAVYSAMVWALKAWLNVLFGGLVLGTTQSFECCGGLVYVPFPNVGYMRWDLAAQVRGS